MSTPVERIASLESDLRKALEDIEDLKTETKGLARFQAWITGAWTAFAFLFGIFAADIKKKFGMP